MTAERRPSGNVRSYAFADHVVRAGAGIVVAVEPDERRARELPRLPERFRGAAARLVSVERAARL